MQAGNRVVAISVDPGDCSSLGLYGVVGAE